MTPTERGDLAEQLLPVAARLACIVHGDGGPRDIQQIIARLTPHERDALLVVLAGLVDPDQPAQDALGYLAWDEHGRPAHPAIPDGGTVRDLAEEWWEQHAQPTPVDPRAAARELLLQGLRAEQVAARIGVTERTVFRWQAAWQAAA